MVNIGFTAVAFGLWFLQKWYYQRRNALNAKEVARLDEAGLENEELLREAKGNKSPLFRFTT